MLGFSTASGITSVSFEWIPQFSANLSQTDIYIYIYRYIHVENKFGKMKGKNTKHSSVYYYNTLFVLFNII